MPTAGPRFARHHNIFTSATRKPDAASIYDLDSTNASTCRAHSRGFHLITREVVAALPELSSIEVGLLARVSAAHVGLAHDQRKRRSRRAGRPGILVLGNRARGFSLPAHVRRAGRHAGPCEGVAVGQQPDDPGRQGRVVPGHLAGNLSVRAPATWRPAEAGADAVGREKRRGRGAG